jgi:hypothetical protein
MFYILIVVFFSTFTGLFQVSNEDKEFNIENYFVVSELRNTLDNSDNIFSSILKVVLAPFIIIDFLIALIVLLGIGFTTLPPIVTILMIAPLSILVVFTYILPMVRGN